MEVLEVAIEVNFIYIHSNLYKRETSWQIERKKDFDKYTYIDSIVSLFMFKLIL